MSPSALHTLPHRKGPYRWSTPPPVCTGSCVEPPAAPCVYVAVFMKRSTKAVRNAFPVFLLLLASCTSFFDASAPQREGTLAAPGLLAPVEIVRDRFGIPHIAAANDHDLYFAQGFCHAQDRLFQMEVERRLARGELAEVFGEAALPADRFLRHLGFGSRAVVLAASLPPGRSRWRGRTPTASTRA